MLFRIFDRKTLVFETLIFGKKHPEKRPTSRTVIYKSIAAN